MVLKGMIDSLVGVTVGSEVIRSIGNSGSWGSLGDGLKSSTQSLVGLGTLGFVSNSMFKWK